MKLQLVTPVGIKREEEVYEVILPTQMGQIGVFPGHEPLVTLLDIGVVSIRKNKSDPDDALEHLAVAAGIVEIDGSRVLILADEADEGQDITEQEVKAALARAEKMRAEAKDQVDITEAEKLLKRHTTQLKVAELRRHPRKSRLTWNSNNSMKQTSKAEDTEKKDDEKEK
jgi:F-type H+-transporting ATPase subunit epsilon